MDKFVENIVASVLGGGAEPAQAVSRPNYQRRKTRDRLVITPVTPKADMPAEPKSIATASPTADPCAATRRAALAAMVPCDAAAPRTQTPQKGCRCQSASATFHKINDAPRRLGEVLGLRLRPGDAVISVSVACADAGRLVATDDLLVRRGIGPEAMAYAAAGDNALLITVSADAGLADSLVSELRELWQGCAACGKSALSSAPSAKLLNHLGIGRRGAVGVVEGDAAADVVCALSAYLETNTRTDVRLINRAAFLHGGLEEVRAGVDQLTGLLAAIKR